MKELKNEIMKLKFGNLEIWKFENSLQYNYLIDL